MGRAYEYIVFDLGNTLIRFDHKISAGKIAQLSNIDAAKVYDTFFDSGITRPFERGHLSPAEFHRKAAALLGFDIPFEEFKKIWNDIFWADDDMCELARELKKNYKLVLLSNISSLHYEHIRNKFDIINIFDEVILSFEVGAIKPERKIFDELVRRAGGAREKLFYIDDREDLIAAASGMGIESVRFENVYKLRDLMKEKGIID